MTFKEKLQMEHPELVNEDVDGYEILCPDEYGYEEVSPCNSLDGNCIKCWNREMPNTELENVKEAFSEIGKAISKANEDVYKEDMNTAYNKGLKDAWELSRKLLVDFKDVTGTEFLKIFGAFIPDVYSVITPQEALAKLKAYEEQSKIEVGDVVFNDREEVRGIVLDFDSADPCVWVLNENRCVEEWDMCDIKKTDKHIELDSILEQIRGE